MRTGVPSCLAAASDVADQEGDNDSAAPPIRPFGGVGRRVLVNVEGLDADGEDLGLLLQGDGMRLLAEAKLEAELSLTLCDSPFIRDLNSQWRGMDQETDVLSFPMDDDVILGDVVICVEVARRQAAERAYDLRDEARVLMVRAPWSQFALAARSLWVEAEPRWHHASRDPPSAERLVESCCHPPLRSLRPRRRRCMACSTC